jgi:hypothetical protein
MKPSTFSGTLLEGHKGVALEVPFDPSERWGVAAVRLWTGRRGYPVHGRINGMPFESAVVPRSRRHYVLVSDEVREALGLGVGETVDVALTPRSAPAQGSKKNRVR